MIRELATQQQRYPLDKLCLKFSKGRADQPEGLAPREATVLINMLKAVIERYGAEPAGAKGDA